MANTESRDNFKVVIKSRPLIKRERDQKLTSQWKIIGNCIESTSLILPQRYTFDHIYDENSTTQELFNEVARPIVEKSVKGFNGTIFAYGQTSSGKTYTMLGDRKNVGVIRLAARQIFSDIMDQTELSGRTFIVKVNYLEIYNEKVYDLLNDRKEIKIQEFPNGELKFGCTGQKVKCDDDILKLVEAGNNHRKVAETNMNVQSSRSHAILQIGIESVLDCEGASQVSVLNLVDLAGSERADSTGATGERLKEAGNINKSLLTLSIVINKLSEGADHIGHIGYRDSKLTRILQTSLGGNAMTVMICAITPAALEETNLTLGFATRAKKIENKPVINETVSDAVEVKRAKKLIVQLEKQLAVQSEEIGEYRKRVHELIVLKQMTIQVPKRASIPTTQRRKTWASSLDMPPSISEQTEEDVKPDKPVCHLKFGDLGRQVECTDEEWGCLLNDTMGKHMVDFDENESVVAPPSFKFPSRTFTKVQQIAAEANANGDSKQNQHPPRKSFLRTPKSFKTILQKSNDTSTSTMAASPIALDKDKRIRMLEDELEELRHFHQTELMLQPANMKAMQEEIDVKSAEIAALNGQMNETRQKLSDLESRLKLAQSELEVAKKEKNMSVQAKVFAEQNMTSIEYEYEQHVARASRREKELIEQLENVANDNAMKVLKEKLATMTEKLSSLETQSWQDAQKHKSEIENLNAKYNRAAKQIDELKVIQQDYDEVSSQLVDAIQENDEHKKKQEGMKATIDSLTIEINNLKSHIAMATTNDDKEQSQVNVSEIQKLEDKYRMEFESLEKQQTSKLAEIQKLEEIIANHKTEMHELKENHHKEIEQFKQQQTDQTTVIQELEQIIVEQKQEIADCKMEYKELLAYTENIEHSNTLLENVCNQSRMTVEFIVKEAEVLRNGYNQLRKSSYEQDLEQLKLHKTISEFDETVNFSLFNDTASYSVANITQNNFNNTQSIANGKDNDSKLNDLVAQLQKTNAEREHYASQLDLVLKHISSAIDMELPSASTESLIDEQMLHKLDANLFEFKDLKEKCNRLEEAKEKNEEIILSLKSESQNLSDQLERSQADDKQLKDQLENEKSTNVQSTQRIDELNQKLAELRGREHILSKQMEDLSEIKSEQRNQINRLQQMITASTDSGAEIVKLNKEIEIVNEKMCEALVEHERKSAELKKAVSDLESASNEIDKLKNIISEHEKTELTNKDELEKIQRELTEKIAKKDDDLKILTDKITQITENYETLQKESQEDLDKKDSQILELQGAIADHEGFLKLNQEEVDKLQKANDDREHYASRLDLVLKRLSNAMEIESLAESTDLSTDDQMMDQLEANLRELKDLREKFNHLENTNEKNEQMILTLKNEYQKLAEQFERSQTDVKQLKDQLENEKSINVLSTQRIEELNQKLAEKEQREQILNQQIDDFNCIKSEQLTQINHLQQIVAANTSSGTEIETVYGKLREAIAKHEHKSAELEKAISDLENASSEMIKLKKIISEHEKIQLSTQVELGKFQRKLAEKEDDLKSLTDKVTQITDEYEHLQNESHENLDKKDRQIIELQGAIDEHQRKGAELATNKSAIESASREIAELKKVIFEHEKTQLSTQEEFGKIQRELAEKEDELKSLTERITQVTEKYDSLQRQSHEDLNKKDLQIIELQRAIADNERYFKKLSQEEVEKIKREHMNQLGIMEKESKNLLNEMNEFKEVIANYERMKMENKKKFCELQHRITVLEDEQEVLEKLNSKFQTQIDNHSEEMGSVQRQLASMKQSKEKLEFEKQKLAEEMNAIQNKRHGAQLDALTTQSPKRRNNRSEDFDSLVHENRTLKSMQKMLESEVQELRKSTSTVRKIKRQSIHDDTRRISGFDSTMIDLGTQTDPVDDNCACNYMAKQITKLKQELVIIEAKYATFKRSTGVDELQAEVKALKADLLSTKSKLSRTNIDYENLCDKHEKLKLKSAIALHKPTLADFGMQTDTSKTDATFVDQIDWERVNRRAEKYKKAYEDLMATYNHMKTKCEQMKSEIFEKSAKCIETAKLLDEIKPKYSNMKRICNSRWDQIIEFQQKISNFEKNEMSMKAELDALEIQLVNLKETNEQLTRFKRKYEAAKSLCDARRLEIERLNKLVSGMEQNNENIPVNK